MTKTMLFATAALALALATPAFAQTASVGCVKGATLAGASGSEAPKLAGASGSEAPKLAGASGSEAPKLAGASGSESPKLASAQPCP